MRRRDFIRQAAMASLAAGINGTVLHKALGAATGAIDLPKTLVNVMLQGGADFRYLFMPAPTHPDSGYIDAIWRARAVLYEAAYVNYASMFENEYLLATDPASGFEFGIHSTAGWLHQQFVEGRVAIVANAFCSRNRRHDQSILNADAGVPDLDSLDFNRSGWGGRLAEATASRVVELGPSVSVFSKGSNPAQRQAAMVHAEDMRNMALAGEDSERDRLHPVNALARALHSWYGSMGETVTKAYPAEWPYHTWFRHHAALQEFGIAVEQRLEECGPLPEALQGLQLQNPEFAQQCRNLYDACQAPDLLGMRVLSMSYGGWDTHDNEAAEIGANLYDLFGVEGGLATALPLIGGLPYLEEPPSERLVYYFASDFGRQLAANGTMGTDHGRGNYSLLIGPPVRGGVYGEMFPEREVRPDGEGQVPMSTRGSDVLGLTSTEQILAAACDWVEPGAGALVFPGAPDAEIEAPGLLDGLIRV